MKIHFVVLLICLASISAVSLGRKLKPSISGTTEGQLRATPTRVLSQSEAQGRSRRADIESTCEATKAKDASDKEGRLQVLYNPKTPLACCVACQGVPSSRCRSWWREGGSRRPCYLNKNRAKS